MEDQPDDGWTRENNSIERLKLNHDNENQPKYNSPKSVNTGCIKAVVMTSNYCLNATRYDELDFISIVISFPD